ncbi:unnamed protein product, partial [Mesorhabditis belari]|uniref:Major facilitator superfamily (MFS) profile domain-containing protein n=1 Tax=Mesorhabditis belari TaxID=2138241 RepID=A0AAF3F2X3_9BILA
MSDDSSQQGLFGTRARFVVLLLVVLCLTSVWSNILTFNFAVICMNPEVDELEKAHISRRDADDSDEDDFRKNSTIFNDTIIDKMMKERISFTSQQQTYAISIVAVAAILANFPVIFLVNRFGVRRVFGIGGLLSAITTILIPFGIRFGYPYFLALRFLQGLAFAANLPAIGAFCARWAYHKQNGLFIASTVAYLQLAPGFTNPISGPICEHLGWPSVFYLHGCVGLVLFIIYGFFYRNNPGKHPFVGDIEKNKIGREKPIHEGKKAAQRVPYGAILSTPAIWAVWIAAIGSFSVVNLIFLYSPTYMSKVLGYSISHSGFTSALGPLAQAAMKVSVGGVSDKIRFMSEVNKLRMFNSIAIFGSFFFLIVLSFVDPKYSTICVLLFGTASGIIGANTGGFFRAAPILSKQYSHFVTGNISLAITVTMVIVPFIVNAIVKENRADEWRMVFCILGGFMAITNVIFVLLVKGEPCEWTESNPHKNIISPIKTIPKEMESTTESAFSHVDHMENDHQKKVFSVLNYSN